jgi:hypothetical protein
MSPNTPSPPVAPPGYEILGELGRGGMGVVYLARNKLMNRPEVLKVVNPQLLHEAGAAQRFLREIRSAARLSHPNIVTAYAALELAGLLVLAMEYVEGEDLAQLVKARGPLPLTNACAYACQAAQGLQHAFERGMVHRDLKPQNLILSRQGKKHLVKILDFGLAKATQEKGGPGHDLTGTGVMLGTPEYMAPEQTRDAARADIRADLYSLGCTLYFLLSGRPPFQADSLYALLYAHQAREAVPLHQSRQDVPAELAAVVAKMMAKDPARRYQKPAEVAQALAPFFKAGLKPLAPAPSKSETLAATSATRTLKPPAAKPAPAPVATPFLPPTRVEGKAPLGRTIREAAAGPARRAGGKASRERLLGAGAGVLLLAGLVGLWAGGVFGGRTPADRLVQPPQGGNQEHHGGPGPAPPGQPPPGAPFDGAQASQQFVGTWKFTGTELGRPVEIFWHIRPDGTCTYVFPNGERQDGTWQYSDGVIFERFQNGARGKGRVQVIDINQFDLTILDNGVPAYTGLKRRYIRQ